MNRLELIKTLEVVSKGISNSNIMPMFGYFCFTGESVYAGNDVFWVVAPWKVDTPFGVHGSTFLGLLKNSKTDEIEISVTKEHLLVTAGTSAFKLPYKTQDEFVWEEPSFSDYDVYPLGVVVGGIKNCLTTCSPDVAMKAFNQICLGQKGGNELVIYSSDGDALTKSVPGVLMKNPINPIALTRDYCDVISRVDADPSSMLFVGRGWVCAVATDCKVYGRWSEPSPDLDYEAEIDNSIGQIELADIPPEFDAALSRARVLADAETSSTELTISPMRSGVSLELNTQTHMGHVSDAMRFNPPTHKNLEVKISAALIQAGLKDCEVMGVTENCIVLQGDGVFRLIGNMS